MGFSAIVSSPHGYVSVQVPGAETPAPLPPGSTVVALQLGNVFLLVAALGVLCCFMSHPSFARNYLLILACADLGHIYSSYVGMGSQQFWDIGAWNDTVWLNVGVSAFFCVNRIATVMGVFGAIKTRSIDNGRGEIGRKGQ